MVRDNDRQTPHHNRFPDVDNPQPEADRSIYSFLFEEMTQFFGFTIGVATILALVLAVLFNLGLLPTLLLVSVFANMLFVWLLFQMFTNDDVYLNPKPNDMYELKRLASQLMKETGALNAGIRAREYSVKFDNTGESLKMTVELSATNQRDTGFQVFRTHIADDSPLPTEDQFTATQSGAQLHWDSETVVEDYKRRFDIELRDVVPAGEQFNLTYEYIFANSLRQMDYVYFPLNEFEYNIKRFIGKLKLNQEPVNKKAVAYTIDGSTEIIKTDFIDGKIIVEREDVPPNLYIIQFRLPN